MDMEEKVDKMWEDLYTGRGKENPSITTRLALNEDAIEAILRNASKTFWVGIGIIAALIGDAISKYVIK